MPRRSPLALLLVALSACPDRSDAPTTDAGASTTAEPTASGATDTSTSTTDTCQTGGDCWWDTTTDSTTTTGPGCSTDGECPGYCDGIPEQPLGAECMQDCGCESGLCFNYVLGAICGECKVDADCPGGGGCTPPNPLSGVPALCNDGGPGDGCDRGRDLRRPERPVLQPRL